ADPNRDHRRRPVLQGRGVPPGLLPEESDPLPVLSFELRPRCAARGALGQEGLDVDAGAACVGAGLKPAPTSKKDCGRCVWAGFETRPYQRLTTGRPAARSAASPARADPPC